jgi:hypothetical protein
MTVILNSCPHWLSSLTVKWLRQRRTAMAGRPAGRRPPGVVQPAAGVDQHRRRIRAQVGRIDCGELGPAGQVQQHPRPVHSGFRVGGVLVHVGPRRVAERGQGIDERDPGGQERVRGQLAQLRRGQVGDHQRHPSLQTRRPQPAQRLLRDPARLYAKHDAAGAAHVRDGAAFPHEVRGRGHLHPHAGRGQLGHAPRDGRTGAGGDRGFDHDQAVAAQRPSQGLGRRVHVAQVVVLALRRLRGGYGQEMHGGVRGGQVVRVGEGQPAGGGTFGDGVWGADRW